MTAYHLSTRHVSALAVAASLLAAAPVAAQADVLYDNLAANPDFSTNNLSAGVYGQSFNSGAFAVDLHDVALLLLNGDGNPKSPDNSGKLSVELFSDGGDTPGTLISTIGALADSAISTSGFAAYDIVLPSNIALTADTNYWIELVSNGPNAIEWGESDDLSGPGVDGTFTSDPVFGITPVNEFAANQMLVETPEPSALPVFATALLLLGMVLHRRARR